MATKSRFFPLFENDVLQMADSNDRQPLVDILNAHWVMSLATLGEDGPYSTPLFYVATNNSQTILFLSDVTSNHIRHISKDPRVGASVYLETKQVGLIQGVQLEGVVECPSENEGKRLMEIYSKAHLNALTKKALSKNTRLYAMQVKRAKLIDNRVGIGKKHKVWEFGQLYHLQKGFL
ncbi:MAG: pyridoxamine 5'-phosphate oxidase family protein [Deltaproteobacteria bacterium]|nr:pyridoxamine 5'-phosphate oxidase family protein [Deltaproteobacteria bacterium]